MRAYVLDGALLPDPPGRLTSCTAPPPARRDRQARHGDVPGRRRDPAPDGRDGGAGTVPAVRPGHQGTTPPSSKKPPRGPSSGRVASRTAIAAPCSGVRGALKPVKSVAT
jgi:hypothetical protein